MRRVGILLAGCGVYDGSEIQESVLVALALARRGFRVEYLAPDGKQADVVDHTTAEAVASDPPRGLLQEAARIARGSVRALGEVSPADLDAIVVPGGLGAVKNLLAREPGRIAGARLRPDVATLLGALLERRAPVAVLGLAEAILARLDDRPLAQERMTVPAGEVVADEDRRTLFTPGFMNTEDLLEVAEGVERMADRLASWLGAPRGGVLPGKPLPEAGPRFE